MAYDLTKVQRIDLIKSKPSQMIPFDYQQNAVKKLNNHYNDDNYREDLGWKPGLLVMPTGSGKTATTVWWMMKDMVKAGYKVLWLSHRTELLEQAAKTMIDLAPYAYDNSGSKVKQKLQLRCNSGKHMKMSTAAFKQDDIILASIQTIARNHQYLKFILKGVDGSRLLVVIDEAHHTPMPSYYDLLRKIRQIAPGFKLLGLTATPTRMNVSELKLFNRIYDSQLIEQIPMSRLISSGMLSEPIFERVQTKLRFEPVFSPEDISHLQRFGELSERIKDEIAESKERNKIIVDHYMSNRDKYGKTVIFALNKTHCKSLNEEFAARGVRCDYVMAGRGDNGDVINRFREDRMDVLINIQILTEGVDVPDIQTIFLTRPTQSDALLMQMVGRGLRGEAAGGTKLAYIVDFYDSWDRFQSWLNPSFIMDEAAEEIPINVPAPRLPQVSIPWTLILDIYNRLNDPFLINKSITDIIPVGWYYFTDPDLDEGAEADDYRLMVFENQLVAFQEMLNACDTWIQAPLSGRDLLHIYFRDIEDPLPNPKDLEKLADAVMKSGVIPEYFTFAERDEIDLAQMARGIVDHDMGPKGQNEYLWGIYESNKVVEQIFGQFDTFKKAVANQIEVILNGGHLLSHQSQPIYFDPGLAALRAGPCHNLDELKNLVIDKWFNKKANMCSSIEWTKKPVSRYWGMCYMADNRITINCVLDSPDVPVEVMKFLIYHELLHADGIHQHNQEFRLREHLYPNWQEWDHFLDTMQERFDLDGVVY